ncbi:MAG: hypothetical protein EHM28_05045 [Spirochaetaceae bacterium]|nr:MAG: hypothetical protein EHM28_05045 [Spirochaetaceae bacterium]
METRKQITDSRDRTKLEAESKKMFLRVSLQKEIDSAMHTFDISEEMAKARKNRSPRVFITVMLFILGLGAIAVGITFFIQYYSTSIPINISDFEYLAFRDLLDTIKRYDREIEASTQQMADLKSERDTRLQVIRDRTTRALELVDLSGVSAEERTIRSNELSRIERRDIQRIQDEYSLKITEALETRNKAREQLDKYDQRQLEEVRRRERLLGSQRAAFDAEMKTRMDYYEKRIRELQSNYASDIVFLKEHQSGLRNIMENNYKRQIEELILKYNPIFQSNELVTILKETQSRSITDAAYKTNDDTFVRYGLLSDDEQMALDKILQEFTLIIKTLRDIDYKNSIPPSLKLIDAARVTIINSYTSMSRRLEQREQERSRLTATPSPQPEPLATTGELEQHYMYAINTLAALNGTQGYVIDARDTSHILLFMQFGHTLNAGDRVTIAREDNAEVAILRIISADKEIYATLERKLTDKYPVTPFDRVTIVK